MDTPYPPPPSKPPIRKPPTLGELTDAINDQQFTPHYQPKIGIKDDTCAGVEALARWNRPGFTQPTPPGLFVPQMASHGLIPQLTDLILTQAAQQVSRWQREGFALELSVNTSLDIFEDPQLPDRILRILNEADFPPEKLVLEITENDNYDRGVSPRAATQSMAALADAGIRFSLDDYGTGRATLDRLRAYPFRELKHARPHLAGIVNDDHIRDLIRATNNIAHDMGISVTAEGIETGQQLFAAAATHCDTAQGFYLARPMPPEHVAEWCRSRLTGGLLPQNPDNPGFHNGAHPGLPGSQEGDS